MNGTDSYRLSGAFFLCLPACLSYLSVSLFDDSLVHFIHFKCFIYASREKGALAPPIINNMFDVASLAVTSQTAFSVARKLHRRTAPTKVTQSKFSTSVLTLFKFVRVVRDDFISKGDMEFKPLCSLEG